MDAIPGESDGDNSTKAAKLFSLSVGDPSVIDFLNACNEAVELPLVVSHISGGAPAR